MSSRAFRKKQEKGQSAIEFIVVVVVVFFFLLFCLSLSVLLVVSDYIEYATFMTARTYKSMYSNRQVQERNARTVFDAYTNKIQGLARNINLEFVDGGDRGDQAAGVRASYTMDIFYLPPLFAVGNLPGSAITLTTESRLGRDPNYQECYDFFDRFVSALGFGNDARYVGLMDDNGC